MTAYTSTQSGNFSSASTWGGSGYPDTANDTWTVANGHTVTYDVSTALSGGFGTCTVDNGGTFQFASGSRSIRFAGTVNINGNWTQGAGHTVYLNGANGTVWNALNPSATTRIELVGSAPLPLTTTSGATTNRSGVIPVTSSSGFAEGDWIAVFYREHTSSTDRNDEGFIVHEVSGNNIYIRDFVSVRDTITSTDGSKVYLPNPDIWRVNQPVIFGTGSNRNTSTVASVNESLGFIELNDSVVGSVDGETIYYTGPLKSHASGDIVRKVAISITAAYSSGATSITVSDTTGLAAGDEIVIESTSANVSNDEYPRLYEVSSVSGTTINLVSGTEEAHAMDDDRPAYVVKMTRDCKFIGENGQTVRFHRNTSSARYQTRHIRDVEFDQISRTDSSGSTRFYWEGYARGDTQTDGHPVEGCTLNYRTNRNYQSWYFYRENYNISVRCCAVYNCHYEPSFRLDQGYSSDNYGFFNNYAARNESISFQFDDTDGDHWEIAYNRAIGNDDDGFYIGTGNLWGNSFHHNCAVNNKRRGIRIGTGRQATMVYQNEVLDAGEDPFRVDGGVTRAIVTYNRALLPYAYYDFENIYSAGQTTQSIPKLLTLNDHNFHRYADAIIFSGGWAVWDKTEKGWLHNYDNDAGEYGGIVSQIFIPAGATLRVRAVIKVVDGFSGTYPQLRIDPLPARESASSNYSQFDSYSMIEDVAPVATTAATSADWQNVDATLTADANKDRYANVCMTISTDNAAEGFYLRRVHCYLDGMAPHELHYTRHSYTEPFRVTHRNTFTQAKTRVGGRLG